MEIGPADAVPYDGYSLKRHTSKERTLPTQLRKPSIQFAVLLAGIALLTGFAFVLSSAGLTDTDAEAPESASLVVDGVTYRFAPTTCTVTETDFLAAGNGMINGETFWVSASADRVNLTVGPETEIERPADDQLWLVSVQEVRWQAINRTITASAVLGDERITDSPQVRSQLSVSCPPSA